MLSFCPDLLPSRPKTCLLAMAAPQLLWECLKQTNSFVRRSRGSSFVLSAEPGNLCGLHASKYSGLANKQGLGLDSKRSGQKESIVLTTRGSKPRRPGSLQLQVGINKQEKKGLAQLEKAMDGSFYRRDLVQLAKTKYQKIKKSFKKRKVAVKSRRDPARK